MQLQLGRSLALLKVVGFTVETLAISNSGLMQPSELGDVKESASPRQHSATGCLAGFCHSNGKEALATLGGCFRACV